LTEPRRFASLFPVPDGSVVREQGLRCPTPDGEALVADAWHPAGDGRWPVLLQRLPYGRSVASTPVLPHPAWFARRGYAVVVQDSRGRGESTGTFEPFVDEGADGATAIEWAAKLPFADGRVATYGFSYQGLAQLYAAAQRPPSLRAIAPMMCCPDPYEGWTYEGGLRRWPFVCFWAAQLAGQEVHRGPLPFDVGAWPIAGALGSDPPAWFTEWLAHPGDDEWWAARRPDLDAIEVPAFTVLGWFDDFSSGTAALMERLAAEAWCGPWAHMPWGTRHGGAELGRDPSPTPVFDALVGFFDRVFGRAAPAPAERVRYFVVGGGWRATNAWPPLHSVRRLVGTSPSGNANSRWGDGVLGPPPSGGEPTVLAVEPMVPYPGGPVAYEDEAGAQDRRDVACYTSSPVSDAFEIAGSPVVRVTAVCDRPGHDVVVTLHVVSPDGTARTVTGGARRVEVAPGTTVEHEIRLRPIAVRVDVGASLRLAVSGARFPCFDRHRHVADIDPSGTEWEVATLEIVRVEVDLPVSDV
jgi:predicted acyl esterase